MILRPTTGQWHAFSPDVLSASLDTDLNAGLTDREAQRRLRFFGWNELPPAAPVSSLSVWRRQFASPVIWVLIGAALVSGALQEWIDATAILAIVFLNAVLGFVQEWKAERSLAALKTLSVPSARVLRDGAWRSVPSRELVAGDVVQIEAGDHVPADARLLFAAALRTQEAALTGESVPVDKVADLLDDDDVPLADRRNMLFMGTNVAAGKGRAVVVATGPDTELGRIAALIMTADPDQTPLQQRLAQLSGLLLSASLIIVLLVFLLGLWRGEPAMLMFLTAVSLAVAAIPEGLPAVVTITLAIGVTKMVTRHALIRRLSAVETLGAATVICTDKTGTLTKNEMTVTRLYADGRHYDVRGEGYAPDGCILESVPPSSGALALQGLLEAFCLCNSAALKHEHGTWRIIGDPTEGALVVAAAKRLIWKEPLEKQRPVLREVPFDSERKMMTVVRQCEGHAMAYVKGAPDVLLERCVSSFTMDGGIRPLTEKERREIMLAAEASARDGLRVLAAARRPLAQHPVAMRSEDLERDLVFLGLAAMKDPLRPEAVSAANVCREAGIRTVMITGDHKQTAIAIARELGILNGYQARSGAELNLIGDAELAGLVDRIAVYARVSAEHKLRIIKAWKARGAVVAMTGDGVNDAPAIKAADIGVAMGLTGTDVTKEVSDMVVTDDNFASIAAAVEIGRGIYENILKAIHYLVSGNIGEVLVMLLSSLWGLPLPLLPVQILWINLVTDSLPALALAVDPAEPDLMQRPPRRADARILSGERMMLIVGQGGFLALLTLAAFAYCLYGRQDSLEQSRTVAFTVLVTAHLVHAFNCRSTRHSLFDLGLWTNKTLLVATACSLVLQAIIILAPWTRPIFGVTPLDPVHWWLVAGLGVAPLPAMELWKRYVNRTG